MNSYATHIVGGGFDLQSLGNNRYILTLVVYRDCNSQTGFNDPLTIGIFDKQTDDMVQSIQMDKLTESKINPALPKCVTEVPGCTEKAIYSREITLNPQLYDNTAGYYLSWERCCRNHIIQNIQSPGEASMTFYAEIPPPKLFTNSTPKLANNPFTVLCLNNLFSYDIQFTDADNDSLVYEIITPVNGTLDRFDPNDGNGGPILNSGPYKSIRWLSDYSSESSIKGDPALQIDYQTGRLTVKPSETGVFVVAFRVSEFRNGIRVGFVNLELQFTVVECISNKEPFIKAFQGDLIVDKDMYVTIPGSINFRVVAEDEDDIDTVIIKSDLEYEKPENLSYSYKQEQKTGEAVWNWKTYCDLHSKPPKKIVVTATDLGCPIPKTVQRTFYIHVLPMPVLPQTDILCLELHNNTSTTVRFGDSARTKPYFKQYNLYRSSSTDTAYRIVKSIADRKTSTWLDENTPDYGSVNYRYFMKVQNECGYEGLSSDTLGTFDQLKYLPDKQYMYNVTVVNNEWVHIKWNQTKELDFARYFLYKGTRQQSLASFKNIQTYIRQKDTSFLDKNVNVQDTSYCYYVIMLDTCGNYGPVGEPFCTTVLKGMSKPFEHHLQWEGFVTSDSQQVNYSLLRSPYHSGIIKEVGTFKTISGIDDKLELDEGRYEYELDVVHKPHGWNGKEERSRSNREPLYQKPVVYTPNAFTPNNDFTNDTWYVSDAFVKDFHLKVFNRWGQLIFETSDKNQKWNATDLQGNQVPDDVYIYLLNYDGWDGLMRYATGNVSVFR